MSANTEQYRESRANWTIADPGTGGAIPVDRSGTIAIVTGASGQTNTLANPAKAGIRLCLAMQTDGGGDRVVTAVSPGVNASGHTTITLGDAGDFIELISAPYSTGFCWRVGANVGVGLS